MRVDHEHSDDEDEFYVGYATARPPRLAKFVSAVVAVIGCGAVAGAGLIALGHRPLEGGVFEFGHSQSFSGTIVEQPYPALKTDGAASGDPWPLLVAQGKHGADDLVAGLDGQHVSLTGTRILRGGRMVIELAASPVIDSASAVVHHVDEAATGERLELTGEVVDSKCFMGVMVPGDGKTHRDCAALCLRGGISPALLVRDQAGASALVLLAGDHGEQLGPRLSQFAGDTVDVTGLVERVGGWPVMHLQSIRRR